MSTNNNTRVVQPYLLFNGRCEEAVEFYRETLGAKVDMMMRYKENPEPPPPRRCRPASTTRSCTPASALATA